MKKVFDFGKIDYNGTGAKRNLVTVEVEYRNENGREVFSACGSIWNARHTDIICGGQCLGTIAEYIKTPLFNAIFRLWKLYHLNDMHPECEHQRAAGWREQANEFIKIYIFRQTSATIQAEREIKKKLYQAAKEGKVYQVTKEEQNILKLQYTIKTASQTLPEDIEKYYRLDGTEEKMRGWVRYEEDSRGILCKPCPICGYKYGSEWKYLPIPENDKKIILSIMNNEDKND